MAQHPAVGVLAAAIVLVAAGGVALAVDRSGSDHHATSATGTPSASPSGPPSGSLAPTALAPTAPALTAPPSAPARTFSVAPPQTALPTASTTVPATSTLTGVLHLDDAASRAAGCAQGKGEFSDIGAGTFVTATPDSGAGSAVGRLDAGKPDGASTCAFTFQVAGLPTASAYTFRIGNAAGRPPVTVTAASLQQSGNQVMLRLRGVVPAAGSGHAAPTPSLAVTP